MAIDGANLINSFPVYDTRGSVGAYNAQLQKQAAQRAAEQKALNDDINKIKVDGLREADRPDYFKGFEDWRNTAQKATTEKDWKRKSELQSEADKKFLELQSFINQSKEYNKVHHDVSMKLLDDRTRNQFTDDAVQVWQQSGKMPLKDPRTVKDPSTLARQVDTSKVLNELTNVDEDLLKRARYSNPATRRVQSGNKSGTESIYSRTVDPKEQALNYGMLYDTKRDIKAYIQKEYADVFDKLPEDEAKAFAIQDIVKQRPVVRQEAPKMDWDRAPDNFYAHYNYRLQNPLQPSGGLGTPQNIFIPFNKGQSSVPANNYIGLSIPKKNFVGAQGVISLDTGKPVPPLPSSSDYEIVGVGNFPIVNKTLVAGGKDIPKGSLAQDNFASTNPNAVNQTPFIHVQVPAKGQYGKPQDFLVPFNRLPENIKNSKAVREALSGFQPAQQVQKTTTPKATKTVPLSRVKGLVGQKGYEGYTEKELVDYYKSQGYTIK